MTILFVKLREGETLALEKSPRSRRQGWYNQYSAFVPISTGQERPRLKMSPLVQKRLSDIITRAIPAAGLGSRGKLLCCGIC
jgi:hypothetical protein